MIFVFYAWVWWILDSFNEWMAHGAYLKRQPMNLKEGSIELVRNNIEAPFDAPLWVVYQRFDRTPFEYPMILVLAWTTDIMEIGGYMLFPPDTLKELRLTKKANKGPILPNFPDSFGKPVSFRNKRLSGCTFPEPLIPEMKNWIWLCRSYYHTGGRVNMYRSESPKVTYWSPRHESSEKLEIHFDLS